MKFSILTLIILFASTQLSAQSNFEKGFEYSSILSNPLDIEQTSDNGYIIGGGSLIKTDEFGDTTWTKQYFNAGQYTYINGVTQTTDGGYAYVLSTNNGLIWKSTLVKTNNSGDSTFTKTYGGIIENYGNDILETSDGGYLLSGTKLIGGTDPKIYVVKTDNLGNELWSYTHPIISQTYSNSIVEVPGNKYVITGREVSDAVLIKLDNAGVVIWSKTHGTSELEIGQGLSTTSSGGFIFTGRQYDIANSSSSLYLVKTDADGDTLWTRNEKRLYNVPYSTHQGYGFDTKELSNGNILVTGSLSYSPPYDYGGMFTFYFSSGGDIVNDTSFSCINVSVGTAITPTNDGGYAICGYGYGAGAIIGIPGSIYTLLLKIDDNLCVYPTDTTISLMNTGDPNLFCGGSGFTLNTSTTCSDILWDNGSTTEMNTYNLPDTYSATFTNSYGCSVNASITIDTFQTVKPVVNSVSGNSEICTGDSLILFVSDEYVEYWSGPVWTADNDTTIVYNGYSYIATVIDTYGCILNSDPFTVIENPLPTPNISLQLNGDLVSSELSGNQWYLDGSIINTATNQTFTPTSIGTYTVEVTNGNGCVGLSEPYVLNSVGVIDLLLEDTYTYLNGQLNVNYGSWRLFDFSGRLIMTGNVGSFTLPEGMYLLQTDMGTQRISNLK